MSNMAKLVEEVIDNIREDRNLGRELIEEIREKVDKKSVRSEDVGQTLGKYLDVMQKSNEQLVKLTTSLSKKIDPEDLSLSKEDMRSIYDEIKKEEKDKEEAKSED